MASWSAAIWDEVRTAEVIGALCLATDLGIWTLPTMILVGSDGKVLNRNIHIGELDGELKKLLR